jgi:c-di-AMP phosphodiesterase-like protein
MEKRGGGGHINIAAAQVEEGPEEAIARVVSIMRETGLM